MKKKNSRNKLGIALIATAFVALVAMVTAWTVVVQLSIYENSSQRQIGNLELENSRITFCYDHQLKSCDDASLEAWNAAHPDDPFSIGAHF